MSQTPSWVIDIERLALGKPVLLVEGDTDKVWFEHFLAKHQPGYEQRLHVAAAGGKRHVSKCITDYRPGWIGVLDRDEWREADVRAVAAKSSRLHVLSRFCIESYLCDPDELWRVIPPQQQSKVGGSIVALAKPIQDAVPAWVAHGAMWRVLREIHEASRFPTELEERPVTDETTIRQILTAWHEGLAPDAVLAQYRSELARANCLSMTEQLRCYIHGKKFFNQVVVQVLDQLFAGQGADDWQQKWRGDVPILPPPDLTALLDQILALLP